MESEAREGSGGAGVSRSQNAIYVMPHDWASMAQFLEPLVERIDAEKREVQLLVVTPDAETAAAAGAAAVRLAVTRGIDIVSATSPVRAARLIRLRTPHIVTGNPATIAALLRSAALKLGTARSICIAWADELLVRGDDASLESVMTELPKDSARIIVTSETNPAVEELIERYARRARRVTTPAAENAQPVAIEYVTTSYHGRLGALRRVLDEADPPSASVFVREPDAESAVRDMLRSAGSLGEGVHVGAASAPTTELVVLFDLPASREELREAAGSARRVIALIQPRQLTSLRGLAAGGNVKPYTLGESGQKARDDDAVMRGDVRRVLDEGHFGRELLALEPLLEDHDGIEIAAALLQVLERERHAHRAAMANVPAARRDPSPMVKVFVGVGSRDNARPSDLVGAIANQGGVSSNELGRVDVRDSHSIVEVSANVAEAVIERVNGVTIKGRRAIVRLDKQPDRAGRGERGDRSPRGDRGDRSPRGDRRDRGGRDARQSSNTRRPSR